MSLPQWCRDGVAVWYDSSPYHRHRGVIRGEPRPFRDTFTVCVVGLHPPVPKCGDGSVSRAAVIDALTPVGRQP